MKNSLKVAAKIFIFILIVLITMIFSILIILEPNVRVEGLMELDTNRLTEIDASVTFLDENYNKISQPLTNGSKVYVKLSDLPEHTVNAFIAAEDKRFYSHSGIDHLRIISAIKNNLFSASFKEGASTISQQLIKNTHLAPEKTIMRKVQEIRIARELERKYTKEEILEMYLNILYFGNGIYGLGTAATNYFGKTAARLLPEESALLAGIINNPTRYNPYTNSAVALERRNLVLERMYQQNYLSEKDMLIAKEASLNITKNTSPQNQYFNGSINEAAVKLKTDRENIYRSKIKISTYINENIQKKIDQEIAISVPNNIITDIIVCENDSGNVIASCSNSNSDTSLLHRQAGSTLKPFLCYAPALEHSIIYTSSMILDEETDFDGYTPHNYKNKYYGWTSAENALAVSSNVCAVKLLDSVGVERAKSFASNFGLSFAKDDSSFTIALGNTQEGVTLNELVNAYRTIANLGRYSELHYVKSILDSDNSIIFAREHESSSKACREATSYLTLEMLKTCAKSGTAKKLKHLESVAAKTGTVGNSKGNSDACCIAITPEFTIGVRIYPQKGLMENKYSGGTLPAKLVSKIISMLSSKSANTVFRVPSTIISREIDINALNDKHRVLLAGKDVATKDKKVALFDVMHVPKRYSTFQTYTENDSILDEFNCFKQKN